MPNSHHIVTEKNKLFAILLSQNEYVLVRVFSLSLE